MLLCEQNFRDVLSRNESVRAEIGQILHTHTHTHTHTLTHTHAAKLVVRVRPKSMKIATDHIIVNGRRHCVRKISTKTSVVASPSYF